MSHHFAYNLHSPFLTNFSEGREEDTSIYYWPFHGSLPGQLNNFNLPLQSIMVALWGSSNHDLAHLLGSFVHTCVRKCGYVCLCVDMCLCVDCCKFAEIAQLDRNFLSSGKKSMVGVTYGCHSCRDDTVEWHFQLQSTKWTSSSVSSVTNGANAAYYKYHAVLIYPLQTYQ